VNLAAIFATLSSMFARPPVELKIDDSPKTTRPHGAALDGDILSLVGEAFVYEIKTDPTHHIIDFYLSGLVRNDEIDEFVEELEQITRDFAGHEIKIKADLRAFSPASQVVADKIKAVQQFGIENGVKRVAEIVESDLVALQLNRVARESGTDKILRRFWEDESALEWLLHGDQ